MEQGDNGDEPKQGAKFKLEDLMREDGIISTELLKNSRSNSGVLAKAMTAIEKNTDYRQELKTGFFTSERKQMCMVLALAECKECGIDETLVVDLLIAQKAGTKGGFMHDIFQALTHTTFSTNYTGKAGKRWWNKGESKNGNDSSLD